MGRMDIFIHDAYISPGLILGMLVAFVSAVVYLLVVSFRGPRDR